MFSADYWLERANEAAARADDMRDPWAKLTMLDIAESYMKLARKAAARERVTQLSEAHRRAYRSEGI